MRVLGHGSLHRRDPHRPEDPLRGPSKPAGGGAETNKHKEKKRQQRTLAEERGWEEVW